MKKIFINAVILLFSLFATTAYGQDSKTHRIVFQMMTSDTMAHKALMKQLGNLTTVAPGISIEVVCHGPGLEMLQTNKSSVADKINDFSKGGIKFNACEFSLKERKIEKESLLPTTVYVKAGILYIVEKQEQGWSYIKAGF